MDEDTSGLAGAAKWLLTSAGVSGVFIASGYVVETAYQTFLGVEFPDLTTSDYVMSAGGFLLDSINCIYTALASALASYRWGVVIMGLLLLVVIGFQRKLQPRYSDLKQTASFASVALFALVVLLGLGKLVYFDVPAAYVTGLLTLRASAGLAAPVLSGVVNKNASDLKREIICAHNQDWTQNSTDTEGMKQLKTACGKGPETRFQGKLTKLYLSNLGITIAVLSLGIAWIRRHIHSTGRAVFISVLLLFNFVGLCEAYARTIRSTDFRSIGIWRDGPGDTVDRQIKKDHQVTGDPDSKGILLWPGSKFLLLYDITSGKVQQVTREKVATIQVEPEPADVLAEHIKITNKPVQDKATEPGGQRPKNDGGKKK